MTMIAQQEFSRVSVAVCCALVEHLEERDVGTALHHFLAHALARVMICDVLFSKAGLFSDETAEDYIAACEDRDAALRLLQIANPFTSGKAN